MTTPNFDVLNRIEFISTLAIDVMKRNYALVSTSELFDELNELCRNHVRQKLVEEQKRAEKAFAYSKTAQAVIERVDNYFSYSLVKNNHKMRMTSKEYHYMMDRLNDTEKAIVQEWLEQNGGLDKYIFSGFQGG